MAECSQSDISKATFQVESQCQSDMADKSYIPLLAHSVLKNYRTARNVACSRQGRSRDYCVNEVFSDLQVRSQDLSILNT